jgi:hypothetical protein
LLITEVLEGEPLIYAGSGTRAAAGIDALINRIENILFLALETPAHPWSLCPIVFGCGEGGG